jgi:hypothetical protein
MGKITLCALIAVAGTAGAHVLDEASGTMMIVR